MTMADNPTILVTRPEPQASRFATACRDRLGPDVQVVVAPLMVPVFGGDPIDGSTFSAAIFTSEAGVTGAARLWQGPRGRAFAVGDQTAEAATALGWTCESAQGDIAALAALLAVMAGSSPLVWARGGRVAGDLVGAAADLGVRVVERQVYRQTEQDLPVHARALLDREGAVGLPLFSARSAALAFTATKNARADIIPVAISAAAAAGFGGPKPVTIADRPDSTAMLDAIAAIFRDSTA